MESCAKERNGRTEGIALAANDFKIFLKNNFKFRPRKPPHMDVLSFPKHGFIVEVLSNMSTINKGYYLENRRFIKILAR